MLKKTIILIFSAFLISCGGDERPENVLPKDKMVKILTDIHISDASLMLKNYGQQNAQELSKAQYEFIYQKYKISEKDFKQSFNWYIDHPKELDDVYQNVINELSKKQAEG